MANHKNQGGSSGVIQICRQPIQKKYTDQWRSPDSTPILPDASQRKEIDQITHGMCPGTWSRSDWKPLLIQLNKTRITAVGNAARSYLASVSLPFPIQGMVFVPKEMISRVDQRLEEFKAEFNADVTDFTRDYDRLRETAMVYLGDLFNEVDYPVQVERRFSFAWRFIILDVPNGKAGILSPELYEREKEKFVKTMEEARSLAIESLREEFASMVDRITERFTESSEGKPKVFKNATVESFYEFFETFKGRNIFRDEQLAELVEKAQAVLGGVTAENIRTNEGLRQSIRQGMTEIETAMAEGLIRSRRKIVMD